MSTGNKMTIADGLAEIRRLDKRITSALPVINKHASKWKAGPDLVPKQKEHVSSLIQSVKDMLERKRKIKIAIARSNLDVEVEYGGRVMSIHEALLFKGVHRQNNGEYHTLNSLYEQLNTNIADNQIYTIANRGIGDDMKELMNLVPAVFYDEKKVQEWKDDNLDLFSIVDALVDKSNHKTFIEI